MSDSFETSRRDFLGVSARAAALAGLMSAAGCAGSRMGSIAVQRGPAPPVIKPDTKIRVGWIGIGGRGSGLLDIMLQRKDVKVVAIADTQAANRENAAKKIKDKLGDTPELYSGPEDYKRLLEREDVDAVFSALPCDLHGPIYLECFRHGKHFYGEKPLCIRADEANALVEAQRLNPQLIAQIGFQRRVIERYQNGIKMIHDGEFGDPIDGRAAWNNSWGPLGLPKEGERVWLGRRKRSGDWMLEQACHSWDVLDWVAGALPEAACGQGRRDIFADQDPERDVTDFYFAVLRYPKGFTVSFQHTWFAPHHEGGRFTGVFERVAGRKGGIALDEGKTFPRDASRKEGTVPGDGTEGTSRSVNAFFECLHSGAKPASGVVNGRAATLTGLLVRKAVDEGRWVKMSEII